MTCEIIKGNGMTIIVCSRGRRSRQKPKKWVFSIHDVHGAQITTEYAEGPDQEVAIQDALLIAKTFAGAFMVKMGLAERLVCRPGGAV